MFLLMILQSLWYYYRIWSIFACTNTTTDYVDGVRIHSVVTMYKAGKNCNKNLCSVSILADKVEKKWYSIFTVSNEKERLKNKALKVDVVIAMGM